jgi:flagellar L-ring protein precursor FlgH
MFDRVEDIGKQPSLAPIEDPTEKRGYTPVSMPMPTEESLPEPVQKNTNTKQANSLWQPGGRTFFRDQRASRVGDIVTVVVSIDDKAQISNQTKRSRANSSSAGMPHVMGLESTITSLLPTDFDPNEMIDIGSDLSNDGKGSIGRQEKITLRIAATIIQILPNGNMVLQGKQQVNVNFDQRELTIKGIIRPQDIAAENTIKYDQIAEARINYGGKGIIADVQQPRYGDQLFDIIMPF